jgi:hypothetical protein
MSPLPQDTRVLADIAATTVDEYMEDVVDNVFTSNPVTIRLATRDRILVDGGDKIRQPIIYDKLNAGWYSGMDTFDISRKLTKVPMIFDWKQAWANLTVDGLTMLQNNGANKIIDIVETEMETCKLTLGDLLGYGMFGDGTGSITSVKALDGFLRAIDDGTNYGTYGGLTRGADAVGLSVKSVYDATGGATSLTAINQQFGNATIQPAKPDLLATTQNIWNKLWDRVTPQQRYPSGPGFDDLARVGFDVININGAAVVVDSHISAGSLFGFNTKFIKLLVHSLRDFHFTGFKVPTTQDAIVGQVLWAGNLIVTSPRLQFQMRNLS